MAQDSLWKTDGGAYFGFKVSPVEARRDRSILEEEWKVSDAINRYPNPDDKENRGEGHLVTVGPNGSGKTRRLLIPNLYRLENWSTVVVDIKGELAAFTAAHRAKHSNVVVIDPFGVMPANYPKLCEKYPFLLSAGFNPFSILNPTRDDFPDDAMTLAEAMIRVEEKDPHWSQSAQDLVAAAIMYARLAKPRTGSLADVRSILGRPSDRLRKAARYMIYMGIRKGVPELGIKAGRYVDLSDDHRELNSIISNAMTQTRWLDSRPIKADLGKGSFDFGVLKKEPTTVYLILPPRYLVTHSSWLRVLIASALIPLLRSVDDAKVPVLFMLDEFAQLGAMQVVENNLALMRGYGIKLWLVLQDLAQIQGLYPKRWESFIGNSGVLQSFAPQDVTSRDYLAKLFGERLYWLASGGTSTTINTGAPAALSTSTSDNIQHMAGPAFWPQGLSAMALGHSVLFSRGHTSRAWFPDPEAKDDPLGYAVHMDEARNLFGRS